MSDNATAVAAQQDALPINVDAPQPVELELPVEKVDPPGETEPPKKRGRPPANLLISQLKNEKSDLLSANERLMQELEQERRRVVDFQQRNVESTFQQMGLHESKLKAEAENAKKAYEDAFHAQDARRQAEATAALARAESGLADVESWKIRNPKPEPQQQQPQYQQPQQQQPQPQAQLDPATKSWMEENTWFSPQINGRANPDYNRSMHAAAVAYAIRLEDKYQSEGREKDIAGKDYWEAINEHMAAEFPEGDEPEPVRQPSPVAPVSRGTTTKSSKGADKISLSGEERQFVDQMRNSGAMIYPREASIPREKWGQRMSPMDSYVTYWKSKQSEAKNQRN